jgi:hypothetical protein
LNTAEVVPVPETRVFASGPVAMITRFSASSHSTPGGTSFIR